MGKKAECERKGVGWGGVRIVGQQGGEHRGNEGRGRGREEGRETQTFQLGIDQSSLKLLSS